MLVIRQEQMEILDGDLREDERLNQTWMSGAGMSFCVLP